MAKKTAKKQMSQQRLQQELDDYIESRKKNLIKGIVVVVIFLLLLAARFWSTMNGYDWPSSTIGGLATLVIAFLTCIFAGTAFRDYVREGKKIAELENRISQKKKK